MASGGLRVRSAFRQGLFTDKVAIVTGGGTGIGKSITKELLYLGCKVMIASRSEEKVRTAAEEMSSQIPTDSSAQVRALQCNIRKEQDVKNLFSKTIGEFGKLDFLVNNAGGQFPSPAAHISLKGWNAVVDTNLNGTFLCCREAYHSWMAENGGVIVNIIADMWKGFPLMSHTGAARAAVDNLTKSLALEWAANGIRINSVAPGTIYSTSAARNYDPSFKIFENQVPFIPVKRLGNPCEVSTAVCFLLSPSSAFITGETIKVDGGQSLYRNSFEIPDHNKQPAYDWEKLIEEEENDGSPKSKL
ncbi:PREDICTED: peroxisomal trans-2-enoyl-CoA reductase-like [Branchiostoma belcheri]|uniref:Peroxisomal trans-2-enoyl-CoA reductase n=1 Tax=Branchiostoma belcheri TaxID=7741 RepID=A0A6P4ZGF8_BRABE|nr:PREDICTED: peroxisomal trans-2-enoyl-CoA reductase-like [Branchiostoma belcheri]